MYKREAPHPSRSNLDVGDLTSHADDEREIGKVEIIGHAFTGKRETARMSIFDFVAGETVRVVLAGWKTLVSRTGSGSCS